ncbi:MAG: CBS domain-containing protein [Anaerolineales bacterium]|nr:CBS domain-containing protein [Anaerolineales bacterium]
MNSVAKILKSKGNTVYTISKEALVSDALKVFVEKQIGSVVVMEGDTLIGIFTERDFVRKVGLFGKDPQSIRIEEVMTKEVITVKPSQSVNDCMALMTNHHIRHLPVVKGGHLVGILSIGDVVKDMIEELQFMVGQMENYIRGLR